jgi:hypothetical protein
MFRPSLILNCVWLDDAASGGSSDRNAGTVLLGKIVIWLGFVLVRLCESAWRLSFLCAPRGSVIMYKGWQALVEKCIEAMAVPKRLLRVCLIGLSLYWSLFSS